MDVSFRSREWYVSTYMLELGRVRTLLIDQGRVCLDDTAGNKVV
jgi:hypothetical protein